MICHTARQQQQAITRHNSPASARQQQTITRHNSPAITVLTALAAITASNNDINGQANNFSNQFIKLLTLKKKI